jgi:hypothetical protein
MLKNPDIPVRKDKFPVSLVVLRAGSLNIPLGNIVIDRRSTIKNKKTDT